MDDQPMEMKKVLSHDVSLAYVDNIPSNDEIMIHTRRKKVGSANENRYWDTHQNAAER